MPKACWRVSRSIMAASRIALREAMGRARSGCRRTYRSSLHRHRDLRRRQHGAGFVSFDTRDSRPAGRCSLTSSSASSLRIGGRWAFTRMSGRCSKRRSQSSCRSTRNRPVLGKSQQLSAKHVFSTQSRARCVRSDCRHATGSKCADRPSGCLSPTATAFCAQRKSGRELASFRFAPFAVIRWKVCALPSSTRRESSLPRLGPCP